ncbi:MAG: hypothetical protein V6Z82_00685 [Flavobacteriales bacterium]
MEQFFGFLLFVCIGTLGFWVLSFLIGFLPYWVAYRMRANFNDKDKSTTAFTVPPQELNQERSNLAQEITSNVLNENDFSHLKDQELFEPQSINNITPAQKAKLKSSVADYYESMKSDINKKPIFQEFVKDFIKNNNKQTTDKIYNALVEGWKANDYKEEDFDKVYDEIFKDRKQISADIINIAEDIITEETNAPSQMGQVIWTAD